MINFIWQYFLLIKLFNKLLVLFTKIFNNKYKILIIIIYLIEDIDLKLKNRVIIY